MWWLSVVFQNKRFVSVILILVVVSVLLCALDKRKLFGAAQRFQSMEFARPIASATPIGSGEERCRAFIMRMTGIHFSKVRPLWLRNPETGRSLELDMFSHHPRPIAFEFDGVQHKRYTPFYHGTVQTFEAALRRDRLKDELCLQHGVELVRIPPEVHDQPEAYVYSHLVRLGLVAAPIKVSFTR